ncbi:MAG: VOC family protein, partial [Gammaproteobacteria bacterium]|nr:VOC family protein [Gammaproteobacteria bacterium]
MSDNAKGSVTRGAHHIGLTVPSLDTTRNFFIDTLGYEQVGEIADYPAVFLSDDSIMITLWQAVDPVNAVP